MRSLLLLLTLLIGGQAQAQLYGAAGLQNITLNATGQDTAPAIALEIGYEFDLEGIAMEAFGRLSLHDELVSQNYQGISTYQSGLRLGGRALFGQGDRGFYLGGGLEVGQKMTVAGVDVSDPGLLFEAGAFFRGEDFELRIGASMTSFLESTVIDTPGSAEITVMGVWRF